MDATETMEAGFGVETRRQPKLTERGEEYLKDKITFFESKLTAIDKRADAELLIIDNYHSESPSDDLRQSKEKLSTLENDYRVVFQQFIDMLKRNLGTSDKESAYAKSNETIFNSKMLSAMLKIDRMLNTKESTSKTASEVGSRKSHRSQSTFSNISKQRAKLETARIKYEFACKEAEMRKKQAEIERSNYDLQTQQQLLVVERDFKMAEAEFQIYNEDYETVSNCSVTGASLERTRKQRTNEYVETNVLQHELDNIDISPCEKEFDTENFVNTHKERTSVVPPEHFNDDNQFKRDNGFAAEFSRYLIKKELLMTRFSSFNDRPESFPVWKESFLSIVSDLGVGNREHLDLLVKYLGPKSSEQAKCLRNSSTGDPSLAIKRIWERLQDRYGRPELIEAAIVERLTTFPSITQYKDYPRLYELSDILNEMECLKHDEKYRVLFGYLDTSAGVNRILVKLPHQMQQKWFDRASRYKQSTSNTESYPPFGIFVNFVGELCTRYNDPGLCVTQETNKKQQSSNSTKKTISALKTEVDNNNNQQMFCLLHGPGHTLEVCKVFRGKSIDDRQKILKEHKICYRCCNSNKHMFRQCREEIRCKDCDSNAHSTAMHFGSQYHGGEKTNNESRTVISPKCTKLCGNIFTGRSCAKIVLVKVFPNGRQEDSILTYAILDDQSNCSLASSELLNRLNVKGQTVGYEMASCSGLQKFKGRKVSGLSVRAVDDSVELELPPVFECENIPQNRTEIPTPEVARHFPHLNSIAECIPQLHNVEISLLIGRDLVEAHQVHEQITGSNGQPFGQRVVFGWVIIGDVCLGKVHVPKSQDFKVTTFKTHVRDRDRLSIFEPCTGNIKVRELDGLSDSPFFRSKDDEKLGQSIEDREFLQVMNEEVCKENGHWVAPLPFRSPRQKLPNNRSQAFHRAKNLQLSLHKNPVKMKHFTTFMENIFSHGHAEKAPTLAANEECWYLPIFGVYHPKKPDQVRVVFDSSATYEGVSLNSVLMQGPDLTNNLQSILLRFRKDSVAVTADIEQMFYCFSVTEKHKNFLRFLWHENNDPSRPLIEYRMCKHVFGNSPSPAVAAYGLRKSVENSDKDVKEFVYRDFYVDDGLTSQSTSAKAAALLQKTQNDLSRSGLRLHKIASNDPEVMRRFSPEDLAKNLTSLNFDNQSLPTQRSLGLEWDLCSDSFIFKSEFAQKPITKRGILSTINSIFDPLGFLSPIILKGRLILRELVSLKGDWDESVPPDIEAKWVNWRESLKGLGLINVPRCYLKESLSEMSDIELHIFCDASEKAIASVTFVVARDQNGEQHAGFVMGKSKLAPSHGHTIPRLELCAALLGTQVGEIVTESLNIQSNVIRYYTDSRVVLGYLNNRTRRFYNYVSNRVQRILSTSGSQQWHYVSSQNNPADCGTRGLSSCSELMDEWLSEPKTLCTNSDDRSSEVFSLIEPENDKEIRLQVSKSVISDLFTTRFERFSEWGRLVSAFGFLIRVARQFKAKLRVSNEKEKGSAVNLCSRLSEKADAEAFIIRQVQECTFGEEVKCLRTGKLISRKSVVATLNPYLDDKGVMRVKGRLSQSPLPLKETNPIIVPRQSHIARLIVCHFHHKIKHQGRLLTEGCIRSNGFWIVGEKRLISSVIYHCVQCRKLRGNLQNQLMADLPEDRLTPGPPFTFVGIDAFGPWSVVTRKTRGGASNSKRWAIVFTCLTMRAVHIEVVEEMSSSSFINALRRFIALRGNVKQFRSDRGTNFIGAIDSLRINAINVEDGQVKNYLHNSEITWLFNPPHSSHMGGVWERMIGMVRRILEGIFQENKHKSLTHEVLVTFMAEVCAIINSRPLVPISTDPTDPIVLSPALLLNQKTKCEPIHCENVDIKDMYRSHWKHVQALSDVFWKRWRQSYLQSLQRRRKWNIEKPSLKNGDIILLKDKDLPRSEWRVGVVTNAIQSEKDGLVRKAEVRVSRNGKCFTYTRPVTEMVLLLDE